MRLFIVVNSKADRYKILETIPDAVYLDGRTMSMQLKLFEKNKYSILVATKNFAMEGFALPNDTLVLVGPGIEGADLVQIRARVRGLPIATMAAKDLVPSARYRE